MRMLLYIVLTIVGLLVFLAGVLGIIGTLLPSTHTASMTVDVAMPREKVWAIVDDVAAFPSWLPGIDRVEMLPDREGRRAFRQTQGRNSFVLEETAKRAPELVTRTITDDGKMFTGSWEHRFEDLGGGRTRVTVTEVGTVESAIPKAMMRLLVGYDYYLNKFGAALKAKCGA